LAITIKRKRKTYIGKIRKGHETGSTKEDPLFVDIENGDFRLRPDSPALKLGFRPFVLDAGRKKK